MKNIFVKNDKGHWKNEKHRVLTAGPNIEGALIYNLCELVLEGFRKNKFVEEKRKMHLLQKEIEHKRIGILRHSFSTVFLLQDVTSFFGVNIY